MFKSLASLPLSTIYVSNVYLHAAASIVWLGVGNGLQASGYENAPYNDTILEGCMALWILGLSAPIGYLALGLGYGGGKYKQHQLKIREKRQRRYTRGVV